MENTKDYNFFYINEKQTLPIKILITASLGEGRYSQEEINQKVEEINTKNNNGKVELYQDDGENFWNLKSSEKLDIGTKEDNYKKWDELKSRALPIEIEDLLVFCSSNETKLKSNYKLK